jgi:hypothetical protein
MPWLAPVCMHLGECLAPSLHKSFPPSLARVLFFLPLLWRSSLTIPHAGMCALQERINCLNNLAACMIKLDQPEQASALCTQTLDLDPSNKKARLRRGLAYEALSLFAKVSTHHPSPALEPVAPPSAELVTPRFQGLSRELAGARQAVCARRLHEQLTPQSKP